MDISKIEQRSPSSNVYDDLHGVNSLSPAKLPSRSTSVIGYVSPRQIESPQIKRPTVSMILPGPRTLTSIEQMTTLDTMLTIDDTNQSSSIEPSAVEIKDFVVNKDQKLVLEENEYSCICWTIREIIQLICMALFACLIGMFIFTLISYAFDIYWLEQPIINNSSWWWLDNNYTNFTEVDYDVISTTQTINYDDEY